MPKKPHVVRAIWPNAGVEAWYRVQLQGLVRDMARSMLDHVSAAWEDADLEGVGFSNDALTAWAAGIMFRVPDGRILLMHRNDGEGWAFPAGGIEPGETPEGAARREASEETGWAGGDPLHLLEIREAWHVRFFTYTADLAAPFLPFLNGEHSEFRWCTPEYALQFLRLHPGVERTLRFGRGVHAMDAKPTGPELLRRALEKWGAIWRGKLDDLSLDLSEKFANKNFTTTQIAMKKAFADAGFTVKFKPTKGVRVAFQSVVSENVSLIKSIPEQFLKDVQTQVWQSVMKGSDLATLSKGIQEKYGVAYRRAAFIARDQNNKAKSTIENTRRKELGITEAYWQHSTAGKEPRPTHLAMNGKKYKLEDGMYDSAIKENTWPGVEPNCRCTSAPVLPGFEDLVPAALPEHLRDKAKFD